MYLLKNLDGVLIEVLEIFDVVNFNIDMESNLSRLNFSEDNDVNDTYEAFTNAILSVTNKHAPLKKKKKSYRNLSLI